MPKGDRNGTKDIGVEGNVKQHAGRGKDHFSDILWAEVSISHRRHRCDGPVQRIDIFMPFPEINVFQIISVSNVGQVGTDPRVFVKVILYTASQSEIEMSG